MSITVNQKVYGYYDLLITNYVPVSHKKQLQLLILILLLRYAWSVTFDVSQYNSSNLGRMPCICSNLDNFALFFISNRDLRSTS